MMLRHSTLNLTYDFGGRFQCHVITTLAYQLNVIYYFIIPTIYIRCLLQRTHESAGALCRLMGICANDAAK